MVTQLCGRVSADDLGHSNDAHIWSWREVDLPQHISFGDGSEERVVPLLESGSSCMRQLLLP